MSQEPTNKTTKDLERLDVGLQDLMAEVAEITDDATRSIHLRINSLRRAIDAGARALGNPGPGGLAPRTKPSHNFTCYLDTGPVCMTLEWLDADGEPRKLAVDCAVEPKSPTSPGGTLTVKVGGVPVYRDVGTGADPACQGRKS